MLEVATPANTHHGQSEAMIYDEMYSRNIFIINPRLEMNRHTFISFELFLGLRSIIKPVRIADGYVIRPIIVFGKPNSVAHFDFITIPQSSQMLIEHGGT